MKQLKRTIYVQFVAEEWPGEGMSPLNKLITFLVVSSVAIVVLETERPIHDAFAPFFSSAALFYGVVFSIEYILRLWVMGNDPRFQGIKGRLRYMMTFTALIDLLAVLPFYLAGWTNDAFLLRAVRLLRILSLAKLGRYSVAMHHLATAIAARRFELIVSFGSTGLVLLFAATIMYLVEGPVQPEAFGSIPRSLWWGIATLTTVGYGDAYPITAIGQLFAGITAIAAVGIVAMPTGILAAAFSGAFQKDKGGVPSDAAE